MANYKKSIRLKTGKPSLADNRFNSGSKVTTPTALLWVRELLARVGELSDEDDSEEGRRETVEEVVLVLKGKKEHEAARLLGEYAETLEIEFAAKQAAKLKGRKKLVATAKAKLTKEELDALEVHYTQTDEE